MKALRRRMTEDMQLRNLSLHTQDAYVRLSQFARHFNRSPELLGPEEIRSYQVYLTNQRKLAPSSISIAISALRFLYRITLHKYWSLDGVIPTSKTPRKARKVKVPTEVFDELADRDVVSPPTAAVGWRSSRRVMFFGDASSFISLQKRHQYETPFCKNVSTQPVAISFGRYSSG